MSSEIEPPAREHSFTAQCRCVIVFPGGQNRCAGFVSSPDEPVCENCTTGHEGVLATWQHVEIYMGDVMT